MSKLIHCSIILGRDAVNKAIGKMLMYTGMNPFSKHELIKQTLDTILNANNLILWVKKAYFDIKYISAQFSHSIMSDSLRPHESQHARPSCPSPTPGVYSKVHQVGDAIQLSHPLSSPSPPAPNPSQHQGLLQWVSSSHEVAKVLEFQLQHQSFQWTPRTDLL